MHACLPVRDSELVSLQHLLLLLTTCAADTLACISSGADVGRRGRLLWLLHLLLLARMARDCELALRASDLLALCVCVLRARS